METNARQYAIDDQLNGIGESIQMQAEQVKAFNKKLAHNKADTQIIMSHNKDEVSKELGHFKAGMQELEGLVTRRSLAALAADNTAGPDSLFNSQHHSTLPDDVFHLGSFGEESKLDVQYRNGNPRV